MINTYFRNSTKFHSMQYCKFTHPKNDASLKKNKTKSQQEIARIVENSFVNLNSANLLEEKKALLVKLFSYLPKKSESAKFIINQIDNSALSIEEKKLAYQSFVQFFNIDSYAKFAKYRSSNNEIFAIEAAKNAAAIDGCSTSENIQSYGIEDENALIEIAKISAAQNGRATSGFIERYHIRNQEALIEIAKIAAAQDGEYTSYFIWKYNIRCEVALLEIFKIAVAQNGEASDLIQNYYALVTERVRIALAEFAAAYDGILLSKYIHKYCIQDQKSLLNIFLISLVNSEGKALEYFSNYNLSINKDPLYNGCHMIYSSFEKNRMFATMIQDKEIIAKSELGILWDDKENHPTLSIKRIDPAEKIQKALDKVNLLQNNP